MTDNQLEGKLLSFLHIAEKLKTQKRNGETSLGNKESIADHTFRVALMVMLISPYLDEPINQEKALKIALIHDLVEIVTGDKAYFHYVENPLASEEKRKEELNAIEYLSTLLPPPLSNELKELFFDYIEGRNNEGILVRAIDKIEAQIQHNEANISIWNSYDFKYAFSRLNSYCDFDSFLNKVRIMVQEESRKKVGHLLPK